MLTRLKKFNYFEIAALIVLCSIAWIYFSQAASIDTSSPFSPLVDDTFIHLRFAHNLASGYGLVWNIGEKPVEGFTSFLYVIFLGGLERTGLEPIKILPFVGASSTVLMLFVCIKMLDIINPGRQSENIISVIMLGLSPQLRYWSFSGLEITFYTLLLVITLVLYLNYRSDKHQPWLVGGVFGILALTRPEAIGLFFLTVIFDVSSDWWHQKLNKRKTFLLLLSFGIVFLPVFLWKWHYFGYPFPNTYYAKTGAGWIQLKGGWGYVIDSIKQILKGSVLPIFLMSLTFRWQTLKEKIYVILMLAGICGIVILNGGDHFGRARFLVPSLPLIFALGAIGLSEVISHLPYINRIAVSITILVMTFLVWDPFKPFVDEDIVPMQLGEQANREKLEFFNNWSAGFVIMGKELRQIANQNETIAVVPIGAIGYYSEIKVLDMVGLTDPYIAHQPFDLNYAVSWRPGHDKGDGAYILNKKPEYIQLVDLLSSLPYSKLLPSSLQYKSIVEIWESPEFLELYEFYPVEVEGGWYYNLYRLKK